MLKSIAGTSTVLFWVTLLHFLRSSFVGGVGFENLRILGGDASLVNLIAQDASLDIELTSAVKQSTDRVNGMSKQYNTSRLFILVTFLT